MTIEWPPAFGSVLRFWRRRSRRLLRIVIAAPKLSDEQRDGRPPPQSAEPIHISLPEWLCRIFSADSFVKALHMRTLRCWLFVTLAICSMAIALRAQEHRASIRGVVIDPASKGIANVEVKVSERDWRDAGSANRRGRAIQRARIAGRCVRRNVDHPGYGPFIARKELAMNQGVWLRVPLQIGKMSSRRSTSPRRSSLSIATRRRWARSSMKRR